MRLYHASTVRVEKPDTQHARPNLDFGCGFYLTALRSQAESYAQRFKRRGKPAILNEYELDEALGRLRFEKPNHQLCLLSDALIERHLHFVTAEEI